MHIKIAENHKDVDYLVLYDYVILMTKLVDK